MTAPRHFYTLAGAVFMRLGPTIVRLDDQTQVEILDDLKALSDAARAAGARDLRAQTMLRAAQLQHARLVSKLPENANRSAA